MSIKINVKDPCSQNLAKLLRAVAEYIGTGNQPVELNFDLVLKK